MNFDINKKNFIDLNYNLYEILNVDSADDIAKIKKNLNKVLKTYHPDKNCDIEIDIYHHFIICKKILLDNDNKKIYDDFLNEKDFVKLKDNVKKETIDVNIEKTFGERERELNTKHNYNTEQKYEDISYIYNTLDRNNIIINKNEDINKDTFNDIFEKTTEPKNKISKCTDIIIKPVSLICNEISYTSIDNMDKLYDDDIDAENIDKFFLYNTLNRY